MEKTHKHEKKIDKKSVGASGDEPPLIIGDGQVSTDMPESFDKTKTREKDGHGKNQEKSKKKKSKKIPWFLKSLVITLVLSFGFGILAELIVAGLTLKTVFIAYILILVIVLISIVSDVIGVAATSCDIQPFLAMAARKVKGSRMAVRIAKNRDIVNSVCSDIIGDICGIISGACGAAIIAFMAISDNRINLIASVACSTVIAALMITGKAVGKKIGLTQANRIVLGVAKALSVFSKN